ncbi:hypothetical protein Bbelb_047210 [Branchiostoma belcheri]|nr:hypothetical protein Bbelb_047210 [Branchiostoma belcheri]
MSAQRRPDSLEHPQLPQTVIKSVVIDGGLLPQTQQAVNPAPPRLVRELRGQVHPGLGQVPGTGGLTADMEDRHEGIPQDCADRTSFQNHRIEEFWLPDHLEKSETSGTVAKIFEAWMPDPGSTQYSLRLGEVVSPDPRVSTRVSRSPGLRCAFLTLTCSRFISRVPQFGMSLDIGQSSCPHARRVCLHPKTVSDPFGRGRGDNRSYAEITPRAVGSCHRVPAACRASG